MASSVPSSPSYFLGTAFKIDFQAVGQLADGHANAARAEIIAALDQPATPPGCGTGAGVCAPPARCPSAPPRRRFQRRLASWDLEEPVAPPQPSRPVRPPSRITTSPGAGVSRAHVSLRSRAHHRADLHALCGISVVINLVHKARLQGRSGCRRSCSPRRRSSTSLRCGSLPGSVSSNGAERVGRTGHAHGLIDIGPSGQRVADRAADAGGRAAEGLDLRRMVVRFIFEQQQPRSPFSPSRFHIDFHRAGVDFLGFIQTVEVARSSLSILPPDVCKIHQRNRVFPRPFHCRAWPDSAHRYPPRAG